MKITEIISKGELTLSFEVFPPKSETSFENVKSATESIAKLNPAFMSVTYGAGGGTSEYTLGIAENIQKHYGVPTLAHLTCVSSTKQTVRKKIEEIKKSEIENVMALRGDIPDNTDISERNTWDYRYAAELVYELKNANPDFCVSGAVLTQDYADKIGADKYAKDAMETVRYAESVINGGIL